MPLPEAALSCSSLQPCPGDAGLGEHRSASACLTLTVLQQTQLPAPGAGDACAVPGGGAAERPPPVQSQSSE